MSMTKREQNHGAFAVGIIVIFAACGPAQPPADGVVVGNTITTKRSRIGCAALDSLVRLNQLENDPSAWALFASAPKTGCASLDSASSVVIEAVDDRNAAVKVRPRGEPRSVWMPRS